jgi:hypothetical protein
MPRKRPESPDVGWRGNAVKVRTWNQRAALGENSQPFPARYQKVFKQSFTSQVLVAESSVWRRADASLRSAPVATCDEFAIRKGLGNGNGHREVGCGSGPAMTDVGRLLRTVYGSIR